MPSTVVDFSEREPRVLREGAASGAEAIRRALEALEQLRHQLGGDAARASHRERDRVRACASRAAAVRDAQVVEAGGETESEPGSLRVRPRRARARRGRRRRAARPDGGSARCARRTAARRRRSARARASGALTTYQSTSPSGAIVAFAVFCSGVARGPVVVRLERVAPRQVRRPAPARRAPRTHRGDRARSTTSTPVGPRSCAVSSSRCATCAALNSGCCASTSEATPDTIGAASEVPLSVRVVVVVPRRRHAEPGRGKADVGAEARERREVAVRVGGGDGDDVGARGGIVQPPVRAVPGGRDDEHVLRLGVRDGVAEDLRPRSDRRARG